MAEALLRDPGDGRTLHAWGRQVGASSRTLASPSSVERLRKAGIDPIAADRQSPAYLQKFLPAEMTSWAAQVKTIGIPLQ